MPTEKIYKKTIEVAQELITLGLNGWETELTITDEKLKKKTDVSIKFKFKKVKMSAKKKNV